MVHHVGLYILALVVRTLAKWVLFELSTPQMAPFLGLVEVLVVVSHLFATTITVKSALPSPLVMNGLIICGASLTVFMPAIVS